MIAAGRRQIRAALAAPLKWSRRLDRAGSRALERAYPPARRFGAWAEPRLAWVWVRVRRGASWARLRVLLPAGILLFRGLEAGDRWLRRSGRWAARTATAASGVVTPERAIGGVIVLAAAALVVSQFITYRAVEVGQAGYAELPDVAKPPTVEGRLAGSAHAYLLVPLAIGAALLGVAAVRRRRRDLALAVSGLGAIAVAVILLVDLPAGLDAGVQSSRFSDARGVLQDGFFAELAAAAGLVLAGLLYYARPCRIRTNLSGRAASGRRRRRRRQDSSPARVARSA